jgi:hypothetical protein
MARDIIHEVYEPRLERVNIKDVLAGPRLISVVPSISARAHSSRYSQFAIDPQQVRYIHRNAVSNACKYGKPGEALRLAHASSLAQKRAEDASGAVLQGKAF